MTRKLDSSFLSFPPPPSPRTEFFHRHIKSTATHSAPPAPHTEHRHTSLRHRPSPINLYDLPTLEALPTPPSSSSGSYHSIDQTLNKPRRLKKVASQGQVGGANRVMRSFTKKHKEKERTEMSRDNQSSFLPFDDEPRRPAAPRDLPRPTGMSSRTRHRPAPLDPGIFGHRVQVVRAEDPIDMVLRMEKEEKERAKNASFTPFSEISGPVHPLPLDPSIFGHQVKVVRAEDPIEMVLRLEKEEQRRALKQSFSPFAEDSEKQSRSRKQNQRPPSPRVSESCNGSLRQRHDAPMPSILGVIEGDTTSVRREKTHLPMQRPPPSGSDRLQRIPSRQSGRVPPSPTPSTPREYLYPRPESPIVTSRDYAPRFTNRSPPSHTATIDESPTLGSIHLPSVNRHISLSPSTPSISEDVWRSPYVEDPDDEQLTALEILEELNNGVEDGWEFGILAKQRAQAGMVTHHRRTASPERDHHRSSIKEVAKSVRSWRESRKKKQDSRSDHGHGSKAGSIKPKQSVECLEPLYEVHYTIQKTPPPIPPRAPGRSLPPLKVQRVMSINSARSGVGIPIVLDSPVNAKGLRESMETVRRDIPESVILSPPTSPMPIHQQPLPPIPSLSPLSKPLSRLLQTRSKRPSTIGSPHGRPSTPVYPQSLLDSPPRSTPRPRLSAREEPHAQLSPRPETIPLDRAQSRREGMTALSFLALDDQTGSWAKARESLERRQRESVQTHIIPPQELAKLVGRRRMSSDSGRSSMHGKEELEDEGSVRAGRMSFGLSPPPRHYRRSYEPPHRDIEGTSLSPPPRSRPLYPRPSHSSSTSSRPYLHIDPSRSPYTPSPSPSHVFSSSQYSTPSPQKSYKDHDHPFLAYSPPPSDLGHAAELRHQEYSPESPGNEVEKQALSDWLSQPRVRKASVPVNSFVRKRDLGMVI